MTAMQIRFDFTTHEPNSLSKPPTTLSQLIPTLFRSLFQTFIDDLPMTENEPDDTAFE